MKLIAVVFHLEMEDNQPCLLKSKSLLLATVEPFPKLQKKPW